VMSYDRENFDSEYLCPHCGELLYLEHSTPPTEVCLNRDCQLWPSGLISTVDATQSAEPQIYRELQDNENQLVAEISNWKPGALARYAYKARRELITMFLKNGVMPGADYWFAIGELLLMTNKHPSRGTTDSLERFSIFWKLFDGGARINETLRTCELRDMSWVEPSRVSGHSGSSSPRLLWKAKEDLGL